MTGEQTGSGQTGLSTDLPAPSLRSEDEAGEIEPQIDVGRTAAAGVLWITIQKWVIRVLSVVTIAVLTRLLTPEEFGTVAAALTVLPFFFLLADLGFAAYIVQVEKTDRRMLSTAFWFSMTAGILLCGCVALLSPLLGAIFAAPGVVPVLQILSVWVIITAVGSVPMALLRRDMRFATIAAQGAAAAIVAQIAAIVMAFSGLGIWALVAQTLVAAALSTLLAWATVRWHPSWAFSRTDCVRMARFGGQVLGVEFVAMLRAWGEAAVISATLGLAALGLMSIAQRIVQIVQDLTGSAIVPVTNVAFAKIRDSAARLRDAYRRALEVTYAVLSLPLTIVAVAAPLMIPILFGDGWEQSYQVAQVLALAGTLAVGAWLDHGLFYGMGRPGKWFIYALIIDLLTFATTVFAVRWGLVSIAVGFLCVATVATVVRWFLVARALQTTVRSIARPFVYLVTVVGCMGAAGLACTYWTAELPPLLALGLIVAVMFTVHLGITLLMAKPAIREVLRIVRRFGNGSRRGFRARLGVRP
ncbi:lipopolysaccharide biosynthesis protein [Cryobacterium melibiosiphilum]|uniref:Lipopolysaccharide biosynthesis protein n=1 Tax=Cryobacterium melibiosiphilum TaxID=995039 RepID=A0A3A5MKL1_9MICO|nr:lipopolysaccharide biosynthesis protein [Cryobacterium melibiosiphilum]RJT89585.1 lipopolysaccharide biosynthesis protein [Cryobacterium melibiosiphilum]